MKELINTKTTIDEKSKQEQHSMALLRRQQDLGVQPAKKKAYVRVNEGLRTIVTDYGNREPIQYLGDIARILNINVV